MDAKQSSQAALDLAIEQLAMVSQQLKAAQKALRRDWEQLKPRQRSEQSKQVKQLEEQQQMLLKEIELKESEINRLV